MCLIMLQPKGVDVLTRRTAHNVWDNNSDGAGFMLAYNGHLIVRKPFFKFKEFWRAYRRARRVFGTEAPFVIHWRLATHGETTAENTHPFVFAGGKVGLAHNGILPWLPDENHKDYSDTRYFVKHALGGTTAEESMSLDFALNCGKHIGRGNKFVLLSEEGEWNIVNEEEGTWQQGAWYSNTYSLERSHYVRGYYKCGATGYYSEVRKEWVPYRQAWEGDDFDACDYWEKYLEQEKKDAREKEDGDRVLEEIIERCQAEREYDKE